MPLTRDHALALLRTMKRSDLAARKQWYSVKRAAIGEAAIPQPGCKLCPTLMLAVAGGFNLDTFVDVVREEQWRVAGVLERLLPYTGLTYDEVDALISQHDAHPRNSTPEPEYLNAVLGVKP